MTDDPLHRIRATVAILDLRRWGAQLDEFAVFDGFTDEQLVKFLILDAARLLDQMTSDGGGAMTDKFRFAATYPVYGHMKGSIDGDLVELVSDCLWAEERGEQGSTSYWEWTGAEWSPIDVSEHVRQWRADRDVEFAEMDGGLALRPWRVWIAGPQGTKLFHSRHESEAEANAVAASLPSHLRPRVEVRR